MTDPLPGNFTGDSWTASETGGANGFSAAGTGNIDDTSVNLPAGSTVTYVITGTVSATATGTLSNTATVTPPVGTAKTATATDNVNLPDLSITKVDNAGGSSITPSTGNVIPGQTLVYTVVVSNTGTGAATGAAVTDPLPGNFTGDSWTASETGGATGFSATGTGNIDDTSVNLPAGSTVTYVITGTVNPTATGTLSNTASVTPSGGTAKTATDNDNLANLSITKVDNAGGSSITPGQTLVYTVVVSNTGTGNVTGATIADPLPGNFTGDSWTASETGGANGFSATGTGNIDDTSVNLPAGSTVTYVITGTVSATATGTLSNTATVTPPIGTPKTVTVTNTVAASADLSITKVDNLGGSSITPSTGFAYKGSAIIYTIVVSNAGPSAVTGAMVKDTLPSSLTGATFTATATGGATGFTTTGSGNIDDTAVSMPSGSKITYIVHATVALTATGTLTNTATVTPPANTPDPNPANDTATVNDTIFTRLSKAYFLGR